MEDEQFNEIDRLFSNDNFIMDLSSILYIGRQSIFEFITSRLSSEYNVSHYGSFENAINHLLNEKFAIILIDFEDPNLDPISTAKRVRASQPISRILVITSDLTVKTMANIINSGYINGIIPYPCTVGTLIKIINQQDANYTINKAMISIVSQPPTLSKASFLLLDPTLSFGDENQPVDFVGAFIVHNSVPKFSIFFEKTLAHDVLLMAGYLSTISALGEELFKNKETLREINFGGISVIQRFYDKVQIMFLVRNLTRHNQERAEERIEKVIQQIMQAHYKHLQSHFLTHDQQADLKRIFQELDEEDAIEHEKYMKRKEWMQKKNAVEQLIIIYSSEREVGQYLLSHIENQLGSEFIYHLKFISNEQEVINALNEENSSIVILDSRVKEQEKLSEFMDYIKETSPSIQLILLANDQILSAQDVESYNADDFDFVSQFPDSQESITAFQAINIKAMDNAWNIRKHLTIDRRLDLLDPVAVKTLLRESSESFTEEDQPILHGILILHDQEELFQQFWRIGDEYFEFDRTLLSGMIASLETLGSEAFMSKKSILGLEIGGSELIVNHRANFMFLYFIRNVRPNTAVLIEKELEAITSLYYEIIVEAGSSIPLQQLKSIFLQIAYKAHSNFTVLLREHFI